MPASAGEKVDVPTHVSSAASPDAVLIISPGWRSSTATRPIVVWIRLPWVMAEKASSNSGIAGAVL